MAAKKSRWMPIAALALLCAACGNPATGTTGATSAGSGNAAGDLDQLRVAPSGSMDGYSRERFEHWISQPQVGKGCDTREAVLKRDGENVKSDSACKATSGTWTSVYTGEKITDAKKIDIDHMVPLANGWRSGANKWDDQRREQFANDLTLPQLVAVDAKSNRSKGDQDPSTWKPAEKAYWCKYAGDWITVKKSYDLTITEQEKTALKEMLSTC